MKKLVSHKSKRNNKGKEVERKEVTLQQSKRKEVKREEVTVQQGSKSKWQRQVNGKKEEK